MRTKEFKDLSKEELLQKADECFAVMDAHPVKAAKLLEAQFYMNEVDRRENDAIAMRDFRMARRSYEMEWWVIVLIGLELVIAVGGFVYGVHEGNKQWTVLDHMDKSTAATATALQTQSNILEKMNANTAATVDAVGKLQKAQDGSLTVQQGALNTSKNTLKSISQMNDALERQLNLAFEVSVIVTADNSTKHMTVINQGKTAVSVWGVKWDDVVPSRFPDPKFVPPGATYQFFFLEDFWTKIAAGLPKGSQQDIPWDFYLLSADGKQYVARGFVKARWEGDELKLYSTLTAVKQEQWPAFTAVTAP
jgi:hypothetical protein